MELGIVAKGGNVAMTTRTTAMDSKANSTRS